MSGERADDLEYRCRVAPIWAAEQIEDLRERNRMLNDIALSAIALKMNIENGFTPSLYALNRDLEAFQRRFGFGSVKKVLNGDVAQAVEPKLE